MADPADSSDSSASSASMEERVKPCLACGTIMPFDGEVCSLCGAREAGAQGEEAIKPCLACEALIPEDDIFCPDCGDFALRFDVDRGAQSRPRIGAQEGFAAQLLCRLVSIVIVISAALLAGAVALDWSRLRSLSDVATQSGG